MSTALEKLDLSKLTQSQKLALLERLLDLLSADNEPLPEWIEEMADERLAEIEGGKCTWESWEDVKKELLAQWK